MINLFWRLVAYIVTRPPITAWIIRSAQAKPYFHIDGYMDHPVGTG